MLQDQLLRHDLLLQSRIVKPGEQSAIHQKPGLGAVTQNIQPRILRHHGDAGEVDVGGDVFQAHIGQRIGVRAVLAVAHDRAHVALRVVVLALGEAIVQEKSRAARKPVSQGADEGLGLGVDFCEVVVGARHVDRRAQVGGAVGPGQTGGGRAFRQASIFHQACFFKAAVEAGGRARGCRCCGCVSVHKCHAALKPDAVSARQQFHRHGVQHFVAHHYALHLLGEFIDPTHGIAIGPQPLLLARAQGARDIDDGVTHQRHVQAHQLIQNLQRQRATARAKLPHFGRLGGLQGLRHLGRQRLAEQRGHLGRGGEITALRDFPTTAIARATVAAIALTLVICVCICINVKVASCIGRQNAKLGAAVGVITQTGRVQGERHERVKTDPAVLHQNSPAQH